jgi:hypothetical protein
VKSAFPPYSNYPLRLSLTLSFFTLPSIQWVYFLQILDKSVIGYGAIFGMRKEANLVGNQYSVIGSAGYVQPNDRE